MIVRIGLCNGLVPSDSKLLSAFCWSRFRSLCGTSRPRCVQLGSETRGGEGPNNGGPRFTNPVLRLLPYHPHLDKMAAVLADDIFKCISLNENDRIPIQSSLKFVPRSPIDNKPAFSGNGLAPNRRQAITWTNDDPVHWRILGGNGSTH